MITGILVGFGLLGEGLAIGTGFGLATVMCYLVIKAAIPIMLFKGGFEEAKTAWNMSFADLTEMMYGGGEDV